MHYIFYRYFFSKSFLSLFFSPWNNAGFLNSMNLSRYSAYRTHVHSLLKTIGLVVDDKLIKLDYVLCHFLTLYFMIIYHSFIITLFVFWSYFSLLWEDIRSLGRYQGLCNIKILSMCNAFCLDVLKSKDSWSLHFYVLQAGYDFIVCLVCCDFFILMYCCKTCKRRKTIKMNIISLL